ncbi:hypothetical protein L6164_009476 [Bauhinia variegata]|uniref:Uncharacterized protein n=1 Tax=Bauhinia variegata TaxID=167791 RepID=A0ACB9PJZ4_BAUVA|nr:hypothetical protein L6164_009476 [Bauhinia variegata]
MEQPCDSYSFLVVCQVVCGGCEAFVSSAYQRLYICIDHDYAYGARGKGFAFACDVAPYDMPQNTVARHRSSLGGFRKRRTNFAAFFCTPIPLEFLTDFTSSAHCHTAFWVHQKQGKHL